MKKTKYLLAYLLPALVLLSFLTEGWLTFLPLIIYFGALPLLELLIPPNDSNWNQEQLEKEKKSFYYDLVLFGMVPVQVLFLVWFLTFDFSSMDTVTHIGRIISMGMMCGVIGINVGHELAHRVQSWHRYLGDLLLLTSLENHFVPYHNRGHHTNVATPGDPATARFNEVSYVFWFRSQFGSYIQAWQIEIQRMKIIKKNALSFHNKMIRYSITHLLLCFSIFYFISFSALVHFLIAAFIGILLLESVNYIEHYGLQRKLLPSGKYESVKRYHSWNSNHVLGRIVLFELSRHSDHHFKADKPYQILESNEESPCMPIGYPSMMILSLFPPLFFYIMNDRVKAALKVD
tara:strand:+ start:95 stop:1135 length:1041 start_codon:yes stop_codon:yes gene_type:complete